MTEVPVSCNKDCGGGCPLLAHVEKGRVVKITDNPRKTPQMKGCAKGYQMHRALYSPERLRKPLLRTGPRGSGDFKAISWQEALDRIAQKLQAISEKHGKHAILPLGGSGSCRGVLQGVWPCFDEDGIETAGAVNVLSSTEPTLPSQGSRTHSIQVEVTKQS
ncbi:MAG: molybdopterin-dependent oxidoreductase [Deltaproteobacteria bacterium]|nr:molybdopterin-dependent oxidoreductase [Deltaproteobacteria bacterium]